MPFTNEQINAIEKEAREVSAKTGENIDIVRRDLWKDFCNKQKALEKKPAAVISIHDYDDYVSKQLKITRMVGHEEIEDIGIKGVLLSICEDINKYVKEL